MFKIIGDVHSRSDKLERALDAFPDYFPILLGDILDGRNSLSPEDKTKSDLKTVQLLQQVPHRLIAGNHDLGLLDPQSKLTKDTCQRLEGTPELNWLKQAIEFNSFTYLELEVENQKYQLAHAYPYSSATKFEQSHGLKIEGKRYKWYKNPICGEAIKICGHYHEIVAGQQYWVLDGDNYKENCLPVLLLDSKQTLITF